MAAPYEFGVRSNINLTTNRALISNIDPVDNENGVSVSDFRFTSYSDYTDVPSEHKPFINTPSGSGSEIVMTVDRLIPSSGTDITVGGVVISGGATPGLIDQQDIYVENISPYSSSTDDKIHLKSWTVIQNPSGDTQNEHTLRYAGTGIITDDYNVISNINVGGSDRLTLFSGFGSSSMVHIDSCGTIKFSTGGSQRAWDGTTYGTDRLEITSSNIECNLPVKTNTINPYSGSDITMATNTVIASTGITTNNINVDVIDKNIAANLTIEGITMSSGSLVATSADITTLRSDTINDLSGGGIAVEGITLNSGSISVPTLVSSSGINTNSIYPVSGVDVDIQGMIFKTTGITSTTATITFPSFHTSLVDQRNSNGVIIVDTLFKEFASGGPPHDKNYQYGDMWVHDIDSNQITTYGLTADYIWTPHIYGTGTGSTLTVDSHIICDELTLNTLNFTGTISYSSITVTGNISCDELTCNKLNCPDIPDINVKSFCRVATTGALTYPYTGIPSSTLTDNVTVNVGDRVLVWQQSTDQEYNGIWVVSASTWTRPTDADETTDLYSAIVSVSEGAVYRDSIFVQTEDAGTFDHINIDDNLWIAICGFGLTHNSLTGLDVGDYQHLTLAEHNNLTAFNNLINAVTPTTLTLIAGGIIAVDEIIEGPTGTGVIIENATFHDDGAGTYEISVGSGNDIEFKIGTVVVATMELV